MRTVLQAVRQGGSQLYLLPKVSEARQPVRLLQDLSADRRQLPVLSSVSPAVLHLLQDLQKAKLWDLLLKVPKEENGL